MHQKDDFVRTTYMRDDYPRLFQKLQPIDPPARLYHAILAAIAMKRRRMARIRFGAGILTGTSAIAALLPASYYLYTSVIESGFTRYISLLGSDGDLALTYWKELALSLLESLPVIALLGVLVACLGIIVAIGMTTSYAKAAFSHRFA